MSFNIFDIAGSGMTAQRAKMDTIASNIANSIADVFNKEIIQIYKISNVSVIDRALVPENPSNIHLFRDLVVVLLMSFAGCSAVDFY